MAEAELIQGTGEELMLHLEKRRHQKNLLLIIPEEEDADNATKSEGPQPYPAGAAIRNGVPLFPIAERTEVVTIERVRQLLEE